MNDDVKVEDVRVPAGLKHLMYGYAEYVKDVVCDRAIPEIDGLKPSSRRILYTMQKNNYYSLTKCANVAGAVMKLHPHGDQSIYDTLVRMTDQAEYLNVPFILGKGSFGKVYYAMTPAASRYTECKLAPSSQLLFNDISGVDFVPSHDNKCSEPVLLPVAFPSILVNATMGIAVGMSSNIPSYNLVDVNKATIELIKTGKIAKPLVPDFSSRGVYVEDLHELQKIMEHGKGKIKLRGKWHIEEKQKAIVIDEVPYYTNISVIAKAMKQVEGVYDVKDESDFSGMRLVIVCRDKSKINEVLVALLRDTTMQMTITTNITVIIDGKPQLLGVTQLLNEWVKFRKGVLTKKYNLEMKSVLANIEKYEVLVKLLKDKHNLDLYIENVKKSSEAGKSFLMGYDKRVTKDIASWIMGLSFGTIANVAKKEQYLADLYKRVDDIKHLLSHLDDFICQQLEQINQQYGTARKTEISKDGMVYAKKVKERPVVREVYIEIKDKFIKKHTINTDRTYYPCMSNQDLLVLDSKGRVLRVNLEELPDYTTGLGTYLPVYFGIPDDFTIMGYAIEQDSKSEFFYNDGYVSIFNWGTWLNNKVRRKIVQALPDRFNMCVGRLPKKPYMICITKKGKIGICKTEDFIEKSTSARTKLVGVDKGDQIVYYKGLESNDLMFCISSPEYYMGRCKRLRSFDTFNADYLKNI